MRVALLEIVLTRSLVIVAKIICYLGLMLVITFPGVASPEFTESIKYKVSNLSFSVPSHQAGTSFGPVMVAQSETDVDRDLARDIQQMLAERGFDPGPADGIPGRKTRQAIADYQDSVGLPADGQPSKSLYEQLVGENDGNSAGESDSAALPELANTNNRGDSIDLPTEANTATSGPGPKLENALADVAAQSTISPPAQSLANSVWRFVDSTGGEFVLTFLPNGVVQGVLYEQFWSWRQTGDDVIITYDNGMGLKVTRSGTLTGPTSMPGSAEPSRGDSWTWVAEKVSAPTATDAAGN